MSAESWVTEDGDVHREWSYIVVQRERVEVTDPEDIGSESGAQCEDCGAAFQDPAEVGEDGARMGGITIIAPHKARCTECKKVYPVRTAVIDSEGRFQC